MSISRRFLAIAAAASMAAGVAAAKAAPDVPADAAAIAHVMNRIGYGPRPGDIEKVRQIGVSKYVDQQLHPERIKDEALEAMLEPLETLRMSTAEIAREYVIPAQQLKRQRKQQAQRQAEPEAGDPAVPRMQISPSMMKQRQLIVELSQQKVLRATYSERQLQEVLTDFWFNHFNVFPGKGADRCWSRRTSVM